MAGPVVGQRDTRARTRLVNTRSKGIRDSNERGKGYLVDPNGSDLS